MFARVIGGESLAMTHLARPGHLLAPAEGFLGAYASALGDGMAGMVHGEALARFSIGWHRYEQPPSPFPLPPMGPIEGEGYRRRQAGDIKGGALAS